MEKQPMIFLREGQQAPVGVESVAQALMCPSCFNNLLAIEDFQTLDFCSKENKLWQSAIVESPDCVPTEDLNQWESEVTLRPTKVFTDSVRLDNADDYGGEDEDWDEYDEKEGEHYSDKGGHRERSIANQPNHKKHWKKIWKDQK